MAKRLIVMRHAKSSWGENGQSDHARPLSKRGRRDAPAVARRLVEFDWAPNLVLSSDAVRTRETYALMSPELTEVDRVEYLSAFYNDGYPALLAMLREVPDVFGTVLALGHNPGWEEAVYWLSGESIEMTTANCALLECDTDGWDATIEHREKWRLCDVIRPRAL